MHLSAIVLGFAATVAGIDLRLYDNVMCNGGGFYHWENVRPDVCYTYINNHHAGVEWRAIPLDWSISGSIFKGDDCTGGLGTENIYNTSTRCISGKSFSMLCHLPGQDPYALILHLLSLHDVNSDQQLAELSYPPNIRS
jgi:hypothetical protein